VGARPHNSMFVWMRSVSPDSVSHQESSKANVAPNLRPYACCQAGRRRPDLRLPGFADLDSYRHRGHQFLRRNVGFTAKHTRVSLVTLAGRAPLHKSIAASFR
jgi:hypothetical protein